MGVFNDLSQKSEEQQRQEWMLKEQQHALCFLEVKATADILTRAGIPTSIRNLAEFANMFDAEVQSSVDWFNRQAPGLPFQLDGTTEPSSDFDQVVAGLTWISNRRLSRTKGRKVPPLDRSVLGVQKVMQLTGLGRVRILEIAQEQEADLIKAFPEFKQSWVNDDQSVTKKNAHNQHPETKRELIREAINDIAKGRIGVVTAKMIERWNGGAIGLDARQIDRYLSNAADMRDLDKHRARGKMHRSSEAELAAAAERRMRG